jgi:hypothetical protein
VTSDHETDLVVSAADPNDITTNLTLVDQPVEPPPVFVDATGLRRRRIRRMAYVLGIAGLTYTALVGVSLAGGPVSPNALFPFPNLMDRPLVAPGKPDPTGSPALASREESAPGGGVMRRITTTRTSTNAGPVTRSTRDEAAVPVVPGPTTSPVPEGTTVPTPPVTTPATTAPTTTPPAETPTPSPSPSPTGETITAAPVEPVEPVINTTRPEPEATPSPSEAAQPTEQPEPTPSPVGDLV